jgi:murein DD-endopeptidase MepM/ murein hydrolase activator NlpD
MARRLLLCLLCALVVATPAAGGDIHRQKRKLDERISTLNNKVAKARAKEGVLTSQIAVVTAKIRAMQNDVMGAQRRLNALEVVLARHQDRLNTLNTLFMLQTRKLNLIKRSYYSALGRLELRLIRAYETPGVNAVDVMLSTKSMSNLLSDLEYLQLIGSQDKHISDELHKARVEMHNVREETRTIKDRAAAETAVVRDRTSQQHAVTQQLISTQQQLAVARNSKRQTLSSIQESEKSYLHEVNGLQAASAALGARLRAQQGGASSGTGVSASGLIWPVSGPITSPFGWRWGRMHEGVDIGASTGTPIHAAAAGTVVYSGWMDGYGNLVVIDHGNGLATAYGHQSAIAAGMGAIVSQGETIGYVGCTGHCTGPHLHFEVRINGTPVDPLRYL